MARVLTAINDKAIDIAEALKWLSCPECGAQIIFLGSVRASNLGRKVTAVSYDCAIELAEKILSEIAVDAAEILGSQGVLCIIHRVGTLQLCEASVLIGTASPHRSESYKASRFIIEAIKKRLPIWKKEQYEDGESEWLEGHKLCAESHRCDSRGGEVEPHGPG